MAKVHIEKIDFSPDETASVSDHSGYYRRIITKRGSIRITMTVVSATAEEVKMLNAGGGEFDISFTVGSNGVLESVSHMPQDDSCSDVPRTSHESW